MTDWGVVFAALMGPIAAVVITRLMDDRRVRLERKWWVFRTLMAMRGSDLHADHVRALNVVQLEFAGIQPVVESWRAFISHVETDTSSPSPEAWGQKYRDLLRQLLLEIAKALKVDGPEIDLARGGYYPRGWAFQEQRLEAAQVFIEGLSKGKAVRVELVNDPTADAT